MDENHTNDFTLPPLSSRLKIMTGTPDPMSGEPTIIVHDPVSNGYFHLGWIESECLSRFGKGLKASALQNMLKQEAGLDVSREEIAELVSLLIRNGLTDDIPNGGNLPSQSEVGLFKSLLHKYLYFMVPLYHPQRLLDKIYPALAPLFSPRASKVIFWMLGLMVLITFPRLDEFITTYPNLFSVTGMIQIGVLYIVIKIIHEWAHALTATRFGVPVPHMGVAFIVMYPVLYTETSGAWKLTDRKQRAAIGLAGIRAELAMAALALLVWNISPTGSPAQILSFLIVAVSLTSSLLINLNPLMRFDGYYILSDYMGLENLQYRACDFARWKLREVLFALGDPKPEDAKAETEKFLTGFGAALLIYRFFLFTGIAILVYHLFFQPLGLFLFMVEIWYFILRPVFSELKIWGKKWTKIKKSSRTKWLGGAVVALFVYLALPLHGTVTAPAISTYEQYQDIYAPYVAQIEKISVENGVAVKKGEELVVLKSPELDRDLELAKQNLKTLEGQKRQSLVDAQNRGALQSVTDQEIGTLRQKIEILENKKKRLAIVAEFDGVITEMAQSLRKGRTLDQSTKLLRVIPAGDEAKKIVTAYVTESEIESVREGSPAKFIPEATPLSDYNMKLVYIEKLNTQDIKTKELVSWFGGDIVGHENHQGRFVPSQGIYKMTLRPSETEKDSGFNINNHFKTRGIVKIEGKRKSLILTYIQRVMGLVFRELNWV